MDFLDMKPVITARMVNKKHTRHVYKEDTPDG